MPGGARSGMVQAIYTALIGHVEGVLSETLLAEYRHVMNAANYHLAQNASLAVKESGAVVMQVFHERQRELEKMTFEKLVDEAELIFSERFAEAKKFKADLSAMRHLRNLFVHGRAAWLPIASETNQRIDVDRTVLKQAVDRLISAGVISSADVRTRSELVAKDEVELFKKLHTDAAVLHFYRAAKGFEDAMIAIAGAPPGAPKGTRLPLLEA